MEGGKHGASGGKDSEETRRQQHAKQPIRHRPKVQVAGLRRHVAESEALLRRKLKEYHTELADNERLRNRLRVIETVLPPLEGALQRMSLRLGAAPQGAYGAAPAAPPIHPFEAPVFDSCVPSPRPPPPRAAHTLIAGPPSLSAASVAPGASTSVSGGTVAAQTSVAATSDDSTAFLDDLLGALSPELAMLPLLPQENHDDLPGLAGPSNPWLPAAASTSPTGGGSATQQGSDSLAPGFAGHAPVGQTDTGAAGVPHHRAAVAAGDTPAAGDSYAEQLRGAAPEHVIGLLADRWRAFIQDTSFLLARFVTRPEREQPAMESAMQVSWSRFYRFAAAVSAVLPDAWFSLYGLNLDTGVREEPPPEHWRDVARAAAMRPEQVAEVREAVAMYEECVQEMGADQREVAVELSAALEASTSAPPDVHTAALVSHLSQRLANNILAQRSVLVVTLMYAMRSPSLELPLQARVALASWPYVPDMLAVLYAVLELAEEERARRKAPAPAAAQRGGDG